MLTFISPGGQLHCPFTVASLDIATQTNPFPVRLREKSFGQMLKFGLSSNKVGNRCPGEKRKIFSAHVASHLQLLGRYLKFGACLGGKNLRIWGPGRFFSLPRYANPPPHVPSPPLFSPGRWPGSVHTTRNLPTSRNNPEIRVNPWLTLFNI